MNRNFLFFRSIISSLITKLLGSFVIFACLPLAAISMGTGDYATFNYSMAITGLLTIFISPLSTALVVRFAHVSVADDQCKIRQTAEETLAVFLALGIILTPLAAGIAYVLSPADHRVAIGLAATAVMITNVLVWAEAFRIGVREDHISSAFGLGNNITIIAAVYLLYQRQSLSFTNLLIVYYGSPLFWNVLSFTHLLLARKVRIRWCFQANIWKRTAFEAAPLFVQTISDYTQLYVSSILAFHLASPQSYVVFSTLILFIARLTNPFSLFARPLIPAYVDAVKRVDRVWIAKLNRIARGVFALAIGSVAIVGVGTMFMTFPDVRFGAIQIEAHEVKPYLVLSLLRFWGSVVSTVLVSTYLAQRKMRQFGMVSLIANGLAVAVGAALIVRFDAIAMFATITVFNCIGVGYLAKQFLEIGFADPVPS